MASITGLNTSLKPAITAYRAHRAATDTTDPRLAPEQRVSGDLRALHRMVPAGEFRRHAVHRTSLAAASMGGGTAAVATARVSHGTNAESALWIRQQALISFAAHCVGAAAYAGLKRLLDLALATLALILLAPLMLGVAIAIRRTDGGPVFFRQVRVGKGGREFLCWKFRSMVVNAEALMQELEQQNQHDDPRTFKMADDPRITRVGRFLRRFSIDELPQVFNILAGDMSIVGPRPPLPREVALYSAADWRRLEVKPGLTCLWQISGRSRLPFPEQVRLDVEYIERRNLLLDCAIILKTVPAVLGGDGAA